MEEEIENSVKGENKIQDGPIIIKVLSKDIIIICLYKEIQIYKINKKSIKKINTITLKKNIISLLIKEDYLIASLIDGEIIILKKDEKDNYAKVKNFKLFNNNEKYICLLDLQENNLICVLTYYSLKIIELDKASIISKFILPKEEEEGNDGSDNENDDWEFSYSNPGPQPFILKKPKSNNYYICFKHNFNYIVFDYQKMKIMKKINLKNYFSFQIYKPKDTYNHFFVLLLNEKGSIQVQKISNNLNIIESFKTSFKFPNAGAIDSDDESESTEHKEDDCIHRAIVDDLNNFYFIYEATLGPPFEMQTYFLYVYKNGKRMKKIEIGKCDCNADYDDDNGKEIDLNFIKIGKSKLLYVKVNQFEGIDKIRIVNI